MAAPSPFLVLSPCISGDARKSERKSPLLASPARHTFGQRSAPKTKTPVSTNIEETYRNPKARALLNWLDKLPAQNQGSVEEESTYNILSSTTQENDRAGTGVPDTR